MTKTEYVTGFESRKETGELHAPAEAQPANQQAFTFCFAMDYLDGEDHTIESRPNTSSGASTSPSFGLPGRDRS